MTVSCDKCPLRSRRIFKNLTDRELDFMKSFKMGELQVDAGAAVIMEGSKSPHFFTVLSGVGIRDKTLPDGRRQITNFVFPGDLVGLQAGLLGEMKHGVEATSDMVFCVFQRERIWDLFKNHPSRAYDVTWLAATEVRSISDSLLSVGRRTARERTARMFTYLMRRAQESGFASSENSMPFPFRQLQLADAIGVSLVHTNKMIQSLRRDGLIELEDGILTVPDLEALHEVALSDEEPDDPGRPLL